MSTNTSSVTNHFPKPQNGFTTTTSGSVSSGAATVGLNSVAGYSNGDIAVFVIDPTDASKKQTFTGVIDTSGVQVTSVVWTAGTNQTHALGATVVDYAAATHIAMMSKGILTQHKQDGTHSAVTATSLVTTAAVTAGNGLTVTTGSVSLPSASISQAALPLGAVVQVVTTNFAAVATGTTTTPLDDTIPQITEGTEFMTQAITPKSATNVLVIEAIIVAAATGVNFITVALHQDAVANALAAVPVQIDAANTVHPAPLGHTMAAGTTSATTFRIRIGPNSADTVTFNGRAGGRVYGAITKSFIKITEYKA